ncbi:uncharacterized protein MAM_05417 [Metarhizium album ARSEF 1941]|uniref:Uncharacterized protein n=1 Tax=Metarhizium album (strain ARSEF 1941) TaxID=1081103 RepID=A0A0B2WLC1_METAS|nr:uncharacterized protein MAM_05417 [Metarhizium album ARSEF 1941]KHN96861.1 hypothetical protein MAM_05417 [Metarhizium album ARSEF 1941]
MPQMTCTSTAMDGHEVSKCGNRNDTTANGAGQQSTTTTTTTTLRKSRPVRASASTRASVLDGFDGELARQQHSNGPGPGTRTRTGTRRGEAKR